MKQALRLVAASMVLLAGAARAQPGKQAIATLVQNEEASNAHRGRYTYINEERSDRTGGHLWRERVAETGWGKVRYLVAEDGKPLAGDRLAAERARVEAEGANPEEFKRQESARADDEQHARQMLMLLPRAFLFDAPVAEGSNLRIPFRPNPDYSPQSMEERVLHGMSGTVLVDAKAMRLRGLSGEMPQDVNIGFGLLATIHKGSSFSTLREHLEGLDWKTESLHTDIRGKALFLKTVARQQDAKHTAFRRIPDDMTVAAAVAMVEQATP